MTSSDFVVRTGTWLDLEPVTAFETIIDELALHLARLGVRFDTGPQGRVVEGDVVVGRVVAWNPGAALRLEWHPASWESGKPTEMELRFEAAGPGTQVTLEHRGLGPLLGDAAESAGWFAGQVAAPLMRAVAPRGLGDWLTDRRARRPSGAQARAVYRDPLYHRPNFRAILGTLALRPDDYLVEVGCGGGAFLADVLRSGCRAAAVDHSGDMVRLAREVNREAVAAGLLTIEQGTAERLPFPDGTFTCGVMTGVFGFLSDPLAALAELHRVLADGGRLVVMGSDPAWRGTPAAPEPMASLLHFYDDGEFQELGRRAGFVDARVVRIPLDAFAREAGVPQEHLALFSGPGAPFLIARKSRLGR
jgi:SAM-dependent methyltransferase